MKDYIKESCENIDAAFFSSDIFHNTNSLEEIEEYLDHWTREVKSIKETLTDPA